MKSIPGRSVRSLLRGRLSPPPSYLYDSLPSATSIRLLELQGIEQGEIQCSLKIFEHGAPPYSALSYTWGSPLSKFSDSSESTTLSHLEFLRRVSDSAPKSLLRDGQSLFPDRMTKHDARCFPISCDGRTLLVTANLHDALQMLGNAAARTQEPHARYVWVDSICVDQENISERNAQVAMMADTYRAAQHVNIWLGVRDQFTEDAITVIDWILSLPKGSWKSIGYTDFYNNNLHQTVGISKRPLTYFNWLGFLAFVNRPWFRRAWVVQELALARAATLICGPRSIRWQDFDKALHFIREKRWYHHLTTDKMRHIAELQKNPGIYAEFLKSKTHFSMGVSSLARTRYWFQSEPSKKAPSSLGMMMQTHRDTRATDPRDKVYAFMGLADDPSTKSTLIEPDYKQPVQQIYTQVTTNLLLSRGELHLLSHVQDASSTKITGLPSWVPDFTASLHPYPLLYRGRCNWSACGDLTWKPDTLEMSKGILRLQGSQVDVIKEVAAMPNEVPDSAAYWATIVNVAMGLRDQYPTSLPTNAPVTRIEALWRTLITDTYARQHPAPTSCGTLFIDYVLNLQIRHTLSPWSKVDFQPHLTQTELGLPAWHKLLELEPETSPWGSQMYRERISTVMESMFQGTYSPIKLAQLQHELDIASGNMRRVFRTKNGLLGTGPRSLSVGDEVWVVSGAKVPLILRRSREGRSRLVGESYVHGIMHGVKGLPHTSKTVMDIILE